MKKSYSLECGEQFNLTESQVNHLIKLGLIYDSGDTSYHMCPGVEYFNIEMALKCISE